MELRFDTATFGLYPGSVVRLERLDDQALLLVIEQGQVEIKLGALDPRRSISLGTPNTGIEFLAPGEYNVIADAQGSTRTIKVDGGSCRASLSSGETFSVGTGQTASLDGTTYTLTSAPRTPGSSRPALTYSPTPDPNNPLTMDPGEEQLAGAGDWRPLPIGGLGWYPRINADWEPYTNGHWQFIDPWGLTWVDKASWGFTTFHYGGWAHSNLGWYWVPGPAVYSPAQVAWIGASGDPQVGWVPLGPGEVVGGSTLAVSRLINHDHLVVVSQQTFVGTAPINRNRVGIPRGTFDRALVQDHAMVNPVRASMLGPGSIAAHPPLNVLHRGFVSRVSAAPEPLSLDRRLQLHQSGEWAAPLVVPVYRIAPAPRPTSPQGTT